MAPSKKLSLYPLKFDDVIADVLKVQPQRPAKRATVSPPKKRGAKPPLKKAD